MYMNRNYQPAGHHQIICSKLEAVARGEIKRLMLFMPPRHGKSELASRKFPAWYLGLNPNKQIITASYSDELATDFGRDVRNLVADPLYQNIFNVQLRADSKSANRWHTQTGGMYVAAGVGTGITGRGAHILLIDDPLKNRQEADSALIREHAWSWYTSTAYTRLMPNAAVVLVQTRWHEDDLAGRLLQQMRDGGEQWDIVNLRAIDDAGQALWPAWYPLETLETIKSTIGARDWSALYQQEPRPEGGGEFKKADMQYYDGALDPTKTNNYILCDPAGEKKKTSDYTTFWVIGLGTDDNYYVLDILRDRLSLTERADALFRLHRTYKPLQVRYEKYGMLSDIEHFKDRMAREHYRFKIDEVAGQTPKNDRIRRLVPLFERQRVWFPHSLTITDHRSVPVDLVRAFREEEFAAFPVGVHDDMLDSLSRIAEPDMHLVWPGKIKKVVPINDYVHHHQSTGLGWMA